ncbi:hypothetical protein NLX67_21865 [Domibacillus sp. A3M-37]|uniref:hypothetical protein n=1 Tax=Domibacillus sp. A3M-37 TaxID=2962037 RepID=UPI0020B6B514|nr:hypothetical protein [Domibacillus sp. A3M-37]MCP3764963.1 hypothetical protein [Domibacillus sp. A3M-37]
MKKFFTLSAFVFLLSACTNQFEEKLITEEKNDPAYFEYTLEPDLHSSLEFHSVAEDGSTQLIQTPRPYTIQKGTPIKVIANITNNGKADYTFDGNPCDGKLTISITNNEQTFTLNGQGDVSPEACIEPLVTHTLKSGETIKAEAIFQTDYDGLATKPPEEVMKELSINPFTVHAKYGEQQFSATFEIQDKK